jgi:RNA polymerase sigma factor (sigma-70 family)
VEAISAPRPHVLRIPKPRRLLSALSDERLVELVRKGEAAAFEVLYDRYSSGILGFCRHMLGNVADAEDATQHTFIAAHADIERHDRRDLHVKAWLYTIARNRCLSMLRARREQPSDDAVDIATDNLAGEIEQRADLRALLADVTRLPDDQREALVLAEIGDLSHSDISEILGCEVSKVKSLVFQARTALIDRRIARETPCAEIREQLATLRGGALRRSQLRFFLSTGFNHGGIQRRWTFAFAGVLRRLKLPYRVWASLRPDGGSYYRTQLPAALKFAFSS